MFRNILSAVLGTALLGTHAFAATAPDSRPLPLTHPLENKNFYLLSLFQQQAVLRDGLAHSGALKQLAAQRASRAALCKADAGCLIEASLWTDQDAVAASQALANLYAQDAAFRMTVDKMLPASGAYALYQDRTGAGQLTQAWLTCARGMNEILSVYGQGHDPRYPKIDSASVDVHTPAFTQAITESKTQPAHNDRLFFDATMQLTLRLLQWNHRDEAARFEVIEQGENRAALQAIPQTDWQKYPYSVIVVPGEGPEDYQTALSALGRERVRLAAQAFRDGKAPFLLLSGGFVHPSQTHFAEAIEMKKSLIQDEHIPESAILVDPFARHTTTNLRNAAREIYRYHMPFTKPSLIVTDIQQAAYILAPFFSARCQKELGYVPYTSLKIVSATAISWLPVASSLEQDPIDPLDP